MSRSHRLLKTFKSRALPFGVLAVAALSLLTAGPAQAAPAGTDARDQLFRESIKHPKDIALALAYARVCVELRDYEGAIGALERVLFYAPNDRRIQAELGFLYAQMRSHQMARHYFDSALVGGRLDAQTRARITAESKPIDAAPAPNPLFGTLQAGVRYQSNAAFNPDNNILRISSQDYLFSHPRDRGADGNVFGVAEIGYDYHLDNRAGDVIETRFSGYGTKQFRFDDLSIGLYDVSIGPRFLLSSQTLPGASVKPYVAGGQVFLAGQRYLASGGAGIIADLPIRPDLFIEPGAEVRRAQFSNVSVFSSLNTGTMASVSLAAHAELNAVFGATARVFFTRDTAQASYQSSNNIAEQFALVARVAPPLPQIDVLWSVSPYVKLLQTSFDAANPFIDALVRRRDNEIQYGLVLDTPISRAISVITNIEEARIASNIPNYRLHNLTVLTGPTVRF